MEQPVRMNLCAPSVVNVCVDSREGEASAGRLYCLYTREMIPFQNECHLLKIMERLMDRIGYPQASVEMRTYRKKEAPPRDVPEKVIQEEEIFRERGRLATFFIHVQYRQNATWQGEAAWVEQGKVRLFRSDLELLKLMDNAFE